MTEPAVPAAPETPAVPKNEAPAAPPVTVPAPAAPVPAPAPAKVSAPKQDDVRDPLALIDSLTAMKDRFAKKADEATAKLAALEIEHANSKARNALLQAGFTDEDTIAALLPGQVARENPNEVPASLVEKLLPKGVQPTRAPSNGSPQEKPRSWQEKLADGVKGIVK